MTYKMRTAVVVRDGGSGMMWIKLRCGHIVTPKWNGKTFYTEGKTKCRCYECGRASHLTEDNNSLVDKMIAVARESLIRLNGDNEYSLESWRIAGHSRTAITAFVYFTDNNNSGVMVPVLYDLQEGSIVADEK